MRLDLMAILIFSISGLVMAGLQANQHFLLPAMAPAFTTSVRFSGSRSWRRKPDCRLDPFTLPAFGFGIYGSGVWRDPGRVAAPANPDPGADSITSSAGPQRLI